MRKVIVLIVLAVGVAGGVAVVTAYALAKGTPVVVAELFACFLGALLCASFQR